MGNILVFDSVEKIALWPTLEEVMLFGEKDYINDGENIYDLIFHVKKGINPGYNERVTSLVIPVLRQEKDDGKTISAIYHLSESRPDFRRIAVSGKILQFYDILQSDGGKEIRPVPEYNTVPESKFIGRVGNYKLLRDITEKKRMIDRKY